MLPPADRVHLIPRYNLPSGFGNFFPRDGSGTFYIADRAHLLHGVGYILHSADRSDLPEGKINNNHSADRVHLIIQGRAHFILRGSGAFYSAGVRYI